MFNLEIEALCPFITSYCRYWMVRGTNKSLKQRNVQWNIKRCRFHLLTPSLADWLSPMACQELLCHSTCLARCTPVVLSFFRGGMRTSFRYSFETKPFNSHWINLLKPLVRNTQRISALMRSLWSTHPCHGAPLLTLSIRGRKPRRISKAQRHKLLSSCCAS